MINFIFTPPEINKPEGTVEVLIKTIKNSPLFVTFKTLSGNVLWSSKLNSNMFTRYGAISNTTISVVDNFGNTLTKWTWDPIQHGDLSHKIFKLWAINNRGSNGIAIGTHNGMSGEWVNPVVNGELKATLVEPSDIQYKELNSFYNKMGWVSLIKEIITKDGKDVLFYEGGDGFTNSIDKEIIEKHVNESEIIERFTNSKSINDLIIESSVNGKIKWIHIDVEGLDGDLVYAIKDELLPELLLFESLHMSDEYKRDISNYLTKKGYKVQHSGWNTTCLKNE
jgi:hypothetical protein